MTKYTYAIIENAGILVQCDDDYEFLFRIESGLKSDYNLSNFKKEGGLEELCNKSGIKYELRHGIDTDDSDMEKIADELYRRFKSGQLI